MGLVALRLSHLVQMSYLTVCYHLPQLKYISFFFFVSFLCLCSSLPFLHLQHVVATRGSCRLVLTAWRKPAATSALASTLVILSGEWASSHPYTLHHCFVLTLSALCLLTILKLDVEYEEKGTSAILIFTICVHMF